MWIGRLIVKRSLIAGIGQPWMRDLAFGSHVVRFLASRSGIGASVLDLSFSPIAACQLIEDGAYRRVVFVTSRAAGRPRGIVYEATAYDPVTDSGRIHAHIGDAVMGSVSLETLLVVGRYRGLFPEPPAIIEIEPEDETWGPDLSEAAQALVEPAATLALARATGADMMLE